MNLQLQHLLEYPYEVMRAHIILIGCEQHGEHDSASHECKHCYDRVSCMWVNHLPNEVYDKNSGQKQIMALEYALDNMIYQVHSLYHNVFTCSCNKCQWIRSALNTYTDMMINQNDSKGVLKKYLHKR